MIKIFSTILLGTIISINLNANENEISSYSILKYQADFSKQTPQLQESITNEYLRVKKIWIYFLCFFYIFFFYIYFYYYLIKIKWSVLIN